MRERSTIYAWIRVAVYLCAGVSPFFIRYASPTKYSLSWAVFFLVAVVFCITSTVFILLGYRSREAWLWGFKINPLWLPVWRVSGIEMISSSSLIYALSRFLMVGNDYVTSFWLSTGIGGGVSIGFAYYIYRIFLVTPESYQVIRASFSVASIIYIIIIVIILAANYLMFFGLQVGKDDSHLYLVVRSYLDHRYGPSSRLSMSQIQYKTLGENAGTYTLHFQYGENSGDLKVKYEKHLENQPSWTVESK